MFTTVELETRQTILFRNITIGLKDESSSDEVSGLLIDRKVGGLTPSIAKLPPLGSCARPLILFQLTTLYSSQHLLTLPFNVS